ncbi:MAG TPA: HAD family hydrolase [Candidatus Nanoarchaeia archaeon]|nr:HAD family hydrolase [Candidatus Nanoarchaeia archaeon]
MIRNKILFIDFDGTIIDVSARLYSLHQDVLRKLELTTPYSKEEYLTLKRKRIPEAEVIAFIAESKEKEFYLQQREKKIEEWEYLAKDSLFPWSKTVLEQLQQHNTLILCTRRKNADLVFQQLQHLGIKDLFQDVIISSDKAGKMKEHPQYSPGKAMIIGDTEADIDTGKLLNIKTIAVASGMRSAEFLQTSKPDFLLNNLSEILRLKSS